MFGFNLTTKYKFIAIILGVSFSGFGFAALTLAAPNLEINYQGKLNDNTGSAVTDGSYDMEFNLYTTATGGGSIWTESLTGVNQVPVIDGLFSVMLGSSTSLASVDFNQTLYLGVTIGADSEMSPRKILGSVPSAFVAVTANDSTLFGGLATTSFLRSDQDDIVSGLLTFTNGFVSQGSSTITGQTTFTNASTTNFTVSGNSSLGTVTSGVWNGTAIDVSSYTNLGVTATGLSLSDDDIALVSGYNIPLVASSTEWADTSVAVSEGSANWDLAYASTTALTPAYMRGLFSNSIAALTYNSIDGSTSLAAGYDMPLTASTTQWATAYSWGNHALVGYLTSVASESIESLSDVSSMTKTNGDLLSWTGSSWSSIATSSLGINSNLWTQSGSDINFIAGNVGIGTTSPASKLTVDGTLTASGATALLSTLNVSATSTLATTTATSLVVAQGVTVGSTSLAVGGTIRWTGSALEAYDGGAWKSLINSDVSPEPFLFTDQTTAEVSSSTVSNIIQITGIDTNTMVSVSGDGSPQFRICSNSDCSSEVYTWRSGIQNIANNQYLQVRHTTAATSLSQTAVSIVVGTETDNAWTATTGDVEPTAFAFTDQTTVELSTTTLSNIIQITGIEVGAPVSVSGDGSPQFRICSNSDCSSEVSTWGTTTRKITNNQYLQFKLTSAASSLSTSTVAITVGDGGDSWTVTTGDATPTAMSLTTPSVGQEAFTTPGTHSWTAPAGVTSVSVVTVGGGGGGYSTWANAAGSGGGLGYKNNITVVPGQTYSVVVGAGGSVNGGVGGNSYFNTTATVMGCGGGNQSSGADTNCANKNTKGGGYVGDGGGAGGHAASYQGGGGAGGYSGRGGNGSGSAGLGGGGGGGYYYSSTYGTAAGGGVGLLGEGASGAAGYQSNGFTGGRGGSGGANGAEGEPYSAGASAIHGGAYGGGGGGSGTSYGGGNGGKGAVRIIWGEGRSFPSTNTADISSVSIGLSVISTSTIEQVTGLTITAPVSISGNGSPQFRICSNSDCSSEVSTWGNSVRNISNNQYVQVRATSPGTYNTERIITITIGGVDSTFSIATGPAPGQEAFTTPGTHSWTVPEGVISVDVVAVGGGGGGNGNWSSSAGSGGGLGYKNNITVVPGQTYTVVVGSGGSYGSGSNATAGGNSYFNTTSVVMGCGGGNATSGADTDCANKNTKGGGYVGDGGGAGGYAANYQGGGGAGGYSGRGGNGSGSAGLGGGGGGGHYYSSTYGTSAGGGVGLLGEGASGAAGTNSSGGSGGRGGSGGANGTDGEPYGPGGGQIHGGAFGGGAGGSGTSYGGGNGGGGAVRIIWGEGRDFPSTNTADVVPEIESPSGTVAATGGTITYTDANGLNPRSSPPYPGGYTVHTFTSSGTFTVSSASAGATIESLVVAGGGSGGMYSTTNANGGGGAGGVIHTTANVYAQGYDVTVGAGGAAVSGAGRGNNGANSVFNSLTAIGGGGGGATGYGAGLNGGSGGGGTNGYAGGFSTQTGGLGNSGGATGINYTGSGGGGAGGAGVAGSGGAPGGNGGQGYSTSITGTLKYYAGGGGGGGNSSQRAGDGYHGGGRGFGQTTYYSYNYYPAEINVTTLGSGTPDAVANTGGGGGAGSYWSPNGGWPARSGAGGSGIVVIRYPTDGADLAENYPTQDLTIEEGEIVVFDEEHAINIKRAVKGDGMTFAGVISTQPGLLLAKELDSRTHRKLALAGRIPTKVSLENGPIAIGDRITISSTPGVGMKAGPLDPSLGVAIEPFVDGDADGKIIVFIDLQKETDINAIGEALLSPVSSSDTSLTATSTKKSPFDFVSALMGAMATKIMDYIIGDAVVSEDSALAVATTTAEQVISDIATSTATSTSTLIEDVINSVATTTDISATSSTSILNQVSTTSPTSTQAKTVLTSQNVVATNTPSTTEDIAKKETNNVVAAFFNAIFMKMREWFADTSNGITQLFVESMHATEFTLGSKSQPAGVMLYDEVTGGAYCIKVRNGIIVNKEGECTATTTEPVLTTPETSTSEPVVMPPTITLVGSSSVNIEVNSSYSDLGVIAKDVDGNDIPHVVKVNGTEVIDISLDTSTTTTYLITYIATSNGQISEVTREVIVSTGTPAPAEAEEVLLEENQVSEVTAEENELTSNPDVATTTSSTTPQITETVLPEQSPNETTATNTVPVSEDIIVEQASEVVSQEPVILPTTSN